MEWIRRYWACRLAGWVGEAGELPPGLADRIAGCRRDGGHRGVLRDVLPAPCVGALRWSFPPGPEKVDWPAAVTANAVADAQPHRRVSAWGGRRQPGGPSGAHHATPAVAGRLMWGLDLGGFLADVVFYVFTIISYERFTRWVVRRPDYPRAVMNSAASAGAGPHDRCGARLRRRAVAAAAPLAVARWAANAPTTAVTHHRDRRCGPARGRQVADQAPARSVHEGPWHRSDERTNGRLPQQDEGASVGGQCVRTGRARTAADHRPQPRRRILVVDPVGPPANSAARWQPVVPARPGHDSVPTVAARVTNVRWVRNRAAAGMGSGQQNRQAVPTARRTSAAPANGGAPPVADLVGVDDALHDRQIGLAASGGGGAPPTG